MKTRHATPDDMDALMRMGRRFVEAAWEIPFDPESAHRYIASVVEEGAIIVNPDVTAMLGGIITPCPFAHDWKVATELFWWSERPGGGVHLLGFFERWARERGARVFHMTTVEGEISERAAAIFAHRGYRLREHQWVRVE